MLTIAIPTRNRAPFLQNCLDAFVRQIRENPGVPVRIVVSDNGSTDGTAEVVARFQRECDGIRYSLNDTNLGYQGNVMRLVELVETEYLWFFGDDDLPLDGALARVIARLRQHGAAVYILMDEKLANVPKNPGLARGPDIGGPLLALCNAFGWLTLTSNLSRLVMKAGKLRGCAFERYKASSFTHACLALDAHAHDPAILVREDLVTTPARTPAQEQAVQRLWTEDRQILGYYHTADALEYFAQRFPGALETQFFWMGSHYFWDCYTYHNVTNTLSGAQLPDAFWSFSARVANLLKDRQLCRLVLQNNGAAMQACRTYAQTRQFLQQLAASSHDGA